MNRILKWILIVIGCIVALIVLLGLTVFLRGQSKAERGYDLEGHAFATAAPDSAALARGQHLARISMCSGCHGQDFSGDVVVDDGAFGTIAAPNLTTGAGGVGGMYDAEDWERAIRHGVSAGGRVLIIMGSNFYNRYSDEDLAALVAYLESLPPVDNETPERSLGPVAKLLMGAGQYVPPAFAVDHDAPHEPTPAAQPSPAYGEYLTRLSACGDCHGDDLKGMEIPGPPPGPDLSRSGNLATWSRDDFVNAMRTGNTPDGRVLDSEQMPWPVAGLMSDMELAAVWAFLQSIE